MFPVHVSAEDPHEKYRKIQREMEANKEKLEKTKRQEHSVLEEIDVVSRKLDDVELDLRKQRRNLKQIEAETTRVEADIAVNKRSLEKKKIWMKRKVQSMQRHGQSEDLLLLLTITDDVSGTMRRWKYLEKIALYERKIIEGYAENISRLTEKEKHLQGLRVAMKKEEERIRLTEDSLSEKKKAKEEMLAAVRKERSSYEKMLKDMQEAAQRLLEAIKKLEEKDTYAGKGFRALKGRLAWPVNGKVLINYGSQKDPKFNMPVFRNGIYIKADNGPVSVVHEGKVVYADWFKGYGNLLIVNHGEGYHTLYANLSEIFFKVGDIIKDKDTIGRVGNSGVLNEPSLYFELRYKGKPLNPLQWLKKR